MNSSYPNGKISASVNSIFINPKHLTEWMEGSAVSEAIARLNIESLAGKELNERIQPKEPVKTGGWWCRGVNWRTGSRMGNRYGQAKPDRPHQPEGQKPRKYLTASGMEPDAILLAMPDKDYWLKTRNDTSVPRHWTEGVKKAGAGLSIALAVIALTGVWNWGKDGQLAKEVSDWAQPGTIHYIDFDSDFAENPSCRAAILKFGRLLIEHGCEVHITVWDKQFKGMDDFIKANGAEAFKEAVANALTLEEWERQLKKSDRKSDTATPSEKIVSHPKFETPGVENLKSEIDELLSEDLKRSQLQIKITGLAQKYRIPSSDILKIYRDREQELEQEADEEDVVTEVARLLSIQKSQIRLGEVLPPKLAAPIEELAARLNLRPECYLTALLTQVSSLFKVGTEVLLYRGSDYRCTPNYFAGIVAESSQKKSPIMRAIIDRPMKSLRDKARSQYEKAYAEYESELAAWKSAKGDDKGIAPKPPRQKLYSFSKTTGEGILYQVAEHPDQALMYRCDELAGLFKSANQYRGGKGSDDEDLLEFWNGTGSTVLRASGVKADLDGLLLSVFGTIQPDVLATLLKDCSDSNGKFARFDFVFQPLAASKLSEEDTGSLDIAPMLSDLYAKIDRLPALNLELDRDAKKLFVAFYNAIEEQRVAEPMQGLRAMLGKMPEKVGKMAAIIHTLRCVFTGSPVVANIPKSAVEAAIKFVKFSSDQIASLYAEFSDRNALAPNLTKLILLAERKGGTLSAREAQRTFTSGHKAVSVQQVREWFAELESMNFGQVAVVKKTVSFTLTTLTVPTIVSNTDRERVEVSDSSADSLPTFPTVNESTVGNCRNSVGNVVRQLEPLAREGLMTTVGSVGNNCTSSEKSEGLLLSSLSTNPLKPASRPKEPRTFEVGDRVVVKDVGGVYQGARGKVVNNIYCLASGDTHLVKFDKPVRGIHQGEFEPSDLMKL
ncbi:MULTISPECIES: DUF3987 domain-containing protein [unclassified Microcoleus]|uniref:DUF3987 domain-containing protein n=1 Tax=unclassified Microcoleus TaxID=2642155 RepID=UPI0025D297F7|nr:MULTISPECIES: DUF3987 domain-containing protein [unclassified Microcoleus]